jgi:hypothetical protein
MEGLDPYNSPEYAAYIEGMEAAEEAHQINGLDGPCTKCGEYSVLTGSVCTIDATGPALLEGPIGVAQAKITVKRRDEYFHDRANSWGCGRQDHFADQTDSWKEFIRNGGHHV